MDKKITKVYIAFLIIGILFSIYAGIFTNNEVYKETEDNNVETWKMEYTQEKGSYYCSKTLPEQNVNEKIIAFDTAHMNVEVTIDGQLVYKLEPGKSSGMKTTGYQWNFISLNSGDEGQKVTIKFTPAYKDGKPRNEVYFGRQSEIEKMIISNGIFRFSMALIILIIGIIMLLYSKLILGKAEGNDSLRHFSIFAILLGIWSICEIPIGDLLIPWHTAMVFVDHFTLMVMPIPFLMFLKGEYQNKDNKAWFYSCYFNCGIVVLRILLHIMGYLEFRETLWMTHVSIAILVILVVILSIHEISIAKITRQMKLNAVCILIIMATTILELVVFKISNKGSGYGTMGFLLYVIVMGIEMMRKSRKMLDRAKESEVYRKLAYTDELTGVYNRTAFRRDMDSQWEIDKKTKERKIVPTVIFMFDLNDLKKCNDNYGHEYGDQYITMVSDILVQTFDIEGRCYRIGGDEFCVLMSYTTENEIANKKMQFYRQIHEKNRKAFVVPISVAVGYAIYDEILDKTLDDTMKRADEEMYKNKQFLKEVRRGS